MSNEVKLNPDEEAKAVETQFNQLIQQRNQLMQQRSEIDRKLNEIGAMTLRLQGAYEMAMRIQGKDITGNKLVVPPIPRKEEKREPTPVIPGKKKKR